MHIDKQFDFPSWFASLGPKARDARSSADERVTEPERRQLPDVISHVSSACERHGLPGPENEPSGDFEAGWSPCHYWVLRNLISAEAYYGTQHWHDKNREQRTQHSICNGCHATSLLVAHHLHYETVGAERPGIDLVTVCRNCHSRIHDRSPDDWRLLRELGCEVVRVESDIEVRVIDSEPGYLYEIRLTIRNDVLKNAQIRHPEDRIVLKQIPWHRGAVTVRVTSSSGPSAGSRGTKTFD
jgi:hypothetical protein